jgi:hypothetical protein
VTHRAVLESLRQVGSFIDITEEDLIRLHRSLTAAEERHAGGDHDASSPSGPTEP